VSRRRRFFWLVPLALLLVVGVESLSSRTVEPGEQAADVASPSRAENRPASPGALPSQQSARLVPLYPAGSLAVARPEPAGARAWESSQRGQPVRKPVAAKPHSLLSPEIEGKRPALEMDYRKIGLDRYLEIIETERIGRFFVLIETEDANGLGPEISLRAGTLIRKNDDDRDDLATARPHLVSDPAIRERLAAISLPAGARDDRLVLMLSRKFDFLLWDAVGKTLSGKGLALSAIARVRGAYEEGGNGVFLRFDSAVTRASGRAHPLLGKLRVAS